MECERRHQWPKSFPLVVVAGNFDLILHQLKVYTYATINFRIYKLVLAMLYAQQQRVQEY